jgi:hypothetical protein
MIRMKNVIKAFFPKVFAVDVGKSSEVGGQVLGALVMPKLAVKLKRLQEHLQMFMRAIAEIDTQKPCIDFAADNVRLSKKGVKNWLKN